jgi:hypothetical protein
LAQNTIRTQSKLTARTLNQVEKKMVDKKIVKWIATSKRPPSIVDDSGLKDILSYLGYPGSGSPSRQTVKATRRKVQENIRDDIKQRYAGLVKQGTVFAGTMDGWSSPSMHAFIAITLHYISPDWVLQSDCVGCVYTPAKHDAEGIIETAVKVLQDYNLEDEYVGSWTHDNASAQV